MKTEHAWFQGLTLGVAIFLLMALSFSASAEEVERLEVAEISEESTTPSSAPDTTTDEPQVSEEATASVAVDLEALKARACQMNAGDRSDDLLGQGQAMPAGSCQWFCPDRISCGPGKVWAFWCCSAWPNGCQDPQCISASTLCLY